VVATWLLMLDGKLCCAPQVASWVGPKPRLLVMNRLDMVSSEDKKAWAQYYKDTQQQVRRTCQHSVLAHRTPATRPWIGMISMLQQGSQLIPQCTHGISIIHTAEYFRSTTSLCHVCSVPANEHAMHCKVGAYLSYCL
jgi:hypothetical protein